MDQPAADSASPVREGPLTRLLRRRRRISRNQRRFGGKTFRSWGEYASVPFSVSADPSRKNLWLYAIIGVAAPLLPALFVAISVAAAANEPGKTFWTEAYRYTSIGLMFAVPILGFAALLVIGTKVHIWLDQREAKRRQMRETSEK